MTDITIIGAGLVGLATAYQIKKARPTAKVRILEKEQDIAMHQSTHNSGVIHSGIYYRPGSAKAKNCTDGYRQMVDFAKEYGIAHDICGKIIVATSKEELPLLDNIYQRGEANGLTGLRYLSRGEFREIEPHCEGLRAVQVPQAGIIDYKGIAHTILRLFVDMGGEILFGQQVVSIQNRDDSYVMTTADSEYITKKLISCAGLYADRLTSMTHPQNDVAIIPFRGEYYKLAKEKEYLVKNLIYPVPDPNFPFLGVHFTRMIHGGIEAGPNAVLAFRKEGYTFWDVDVRELGQTLAWPGFRKIVKKYGRTGLGEMYRSLSKKAFTKALQQLVPDISEKDLVGGGAGVRAQACHRDGVLLDDFDIIRTEGIVHVRNAPSPAATSCFAIGNTIAGLVVE